MTVQDAPGARIELLQLSVALLKDQINPAPETATLVTDTLDAPAAAVFFSVTVPVPDSVPEGTVIVSGFGVIDTADLVATPVPVRATVAGVKVTPE